MDQDYIDSGNVLLLKGGMLTLIIALIVAWIMVFDRYFPIAFVDQAVKDFDPLIRGHIDFLIMSALLMGFYAARVVLPWHIVWAMFIGSFTNPSGFVIAGFFPAVVESQAFGLCVLVSFLITSYGFGRGSVFVLKTLSARQPVVAAETA